jgi:hypothetical protein
MLCCAAAVLLLCDCYLPCGLYGYGARHLHVHTGDFWLTTVVVLVGI